MADFGDQSNTLDAGQAVKAAYDKEKIAHRVIALDGLVPEDYDEYDLAYITSGPGIGQVGLMTFKKTSLVVAAVSFTYDSLNRLINVTRI